MVSGAGLATSAPTVASAVLNHPRRDIGALGI
jgi:hypothetical protein